MAACATEKSKRSFILAAISEHLASTDYAAMERGDRYYKQDTDIIRYQKFLYNAFGEKVVDIWSKNHRLATNWFYFFVTQAVQYLLGNGVFFAKPDTKKKLGKKFDVNVRKLATFAKCGGKAFGFWNHDHLEVFSLLHFVPLYDEIDGKLKTGIRFWRLDKSKPMRITLYEPDGVTEYREIEEGVLEEIQAKHSYIALTQKSEAFGEEVVQGKNPKHFPIAVLENVNGISELTDGNKNTIDAYESTISNLTNNVDRSDFIYWVLKNIGGPTDDMAAQKLVEKIKTLQLIQVEEDGDVTPHAVAIPYEASGETLDRLEKKMYRDFMALRVENISAASTTATQIEAAYEPLNQKTNDFQSNVTDFICDILEIAEIDDMPSYSRSSIADVQKKMEMLLASSQYTDDEFKIKRVCTYLDAPEEANAMVERVKKEAAERTPFTGEGDEE